MTYTASYAFFEALAEAGVSYCFVNLGSDHPSIMEAMAQSKNRASKSNFPQIITCPHETVALSMADGFARRTGRAQCVLVHVDVGTQNLGAGIHNASCGRVPVLIFAGLSPVTLEGEMRGSRTEYIHWIQDVPDQKAIVAQYCRYSAEIKTGKNIKQMVNRALSFAMSDPKGPVYLVGAREVMEEEITPYTLNQDVWRPLEPTALPAAAVEKIASLLLEAEEPLVITGYSGRNYAVVPQLTKLADHISGLRVLDTGGSDMCFPAHHPAWLGLRYGSDDSIRTADVILVLDCDVPWIPTQCLPAAGARIVHIDVDPLKTQMPLYYINAILRCRADSFTAIKQLVDYIQDQNRAPSSRQRQSSSSLQRQASLETSYTVRLSEIASLTGTPTSHDPFNAAHLSARLRALCPPQTIWCVEAVTNSTTIADQVQATVPGSWLNCGGGGLGWSGGAALGIALATRDECSRQFICQIVGDGCFLFGVPSSVYWISRRYAIPVLTVVLNNDGWNAPRKSLLLVHPHGHGSRASNAQLNISFSPGPDYGGIAKAAAGGELWTGVAERAGDLDRLLPEAIGKVQSGISAVLDARLGRMVVS